MAVIAQSGLKTVLELIKKENPWLPNGISESQIQITGGNVLADGRLEVRLVGLYGKGYRGSVIAKYHRLELAKLLGPLKVKVGVDAPKTLYNAFGDIARKTGIVFGDGDLLDVSVPPNAVLPYTITLQAKPMSALYHGSVQIEFVQRDPLLADVVNADVDNVKLGNYNSGQYQRAELLTYGYDYTEAADKLMPTFGSGMVLSTEKAAQLATILNAVDNIGWNSSGSNPYNLVNTVVRYHGLTAGYNPGSDLRSPNIYYDRVLILDFIVDLAGADFYASSLYIHYNTLS